MNGNVDLHRKACFFPAMDWKKLMCSKLRTVQGLFRYWLLDNVLRSTVASADPLMLLKEMVGYFSKSSL